MPRRWENPETYTGTLALADAEGAIALEGSCELPLDGDTESSPTPAERCWAKVWRALRHLAFVRRLWGHLGQHLQEVKRRGRPLTHGGNVV